MAWLLDRIARMLYRPWLRVVERDYPIVWSAYNEVLHPWRESHPHRTRAAVLLRDAAHWIWRAT